MNGNASIVRHSYKVERERKQYLVYELVTTTDLQVLTDLIRIEKDRSFHRGTGFDDWLRIKTCSNWRKSPIVTGLMRTQTPGVYYGDHRTHTGKNLLIFQFNDDCSQLTIDYYLGYCPYSKPELITPELKAIISKYSK